MSSYVLHTYETLGPLYGPLDPGWIAEVHNAAGMTVARSDKAPTELAAVDDVLIKAQHVGTLINPTPF